MPVALLVQKRLLSELTPEMVLKEIEKFLPAPPFTRVLAKMLLRKVMAPLALVRRKAKVLAVLLTFPSISTVLW